MQCKTNVLVINMTKYKMADTQPIDTAKCMYN